MTFEYYGSNINLASILNLNLMPGSPQFKFWTIFGHFDKTVWRFGSGQFERKRKIPVSIAREKPGNSLIGITSVHFRALKLKGDYLDSSRKSSKKSEFFVSGYICHLILQFRGVEIWTVSTI